MRHRMSVYGLATVVLCLAWASACRIDPEAFEDSPGGSNGRIQFSWSGDDSRLEAEAQGDLTFNESDSGLESISEGGFFAVTEEIGGRTQRWEAAPNPDGSLSTAYSVNGEAAEMDEEARRWLAQTLPRILRETAFDAAARTRRILESKGADGVIAEISLIRSGRSREIYVSELLASSELDENQLSRLAGQVESGSSPELAKMVELLAEREPGGLALTRELIRIADGIGSGSMRREAIEEILRRRDLDVASTVALAGLAGGIRADSEKASAIISISEKSPKTAETAAALVEAASTIRSSSEASRVLRALISKPGVDATVQAKAARVIEAIHSASEKAGALAALAEVLQVGDATAHEAFLASVASIDSPSEQERVMTALLARSDLSPGVLGKTLSFVRARLPEGPVRERLLEKIQRKMTG